MAINKKVAAAMKKVAKPKIKKSWADSQSTPQSKVYKAVNDKTVAAKPVGFRWSDLGAARLGKNPNTKPTAADIASYKDKTFSKGGEKHHYLYSETRADKTDVKRKDKFKSGGKVKKTWADSQNPPQSKVYSPANDVVVAAKPVGWRWTSYGAAKLGKNPSTKPSAADVEAYKSKTFKRSGELVRYLYSEKRADKSDVKRKDKFEDGGDVYARGGAFSGRQYDPYNEPMDKQRHAKPIGYRFTDARAKRLGESPYEVPTQAQIEKYRGKGVYFEGRQDKSDRTYTRSLEDGGMMARGGAFGGRQYDPYNEPMDKQRHAKPIGYRFTDARAKRLGESPYEVPTIAQIEKYRGKGVYFENRQDKSDRTYSRSLEDGGYMAKGGGTKKPTIVRTYVDDEAYEYARGGVPKTSNTDSKAFTENMLPFKGANLEGKTLDNGDYVVLSYGYYPIWFYSGATHKWYGNKDKYSQSTAKQISQSRPTYDAVILSKKDLEEVMFKSSLGKLHDEERIADEPNV